MKYLPYIFIVLAYFTGYFVQNHRHTCPPQHERIILTYPTVSEMQQFLGVEVDGKFREESYTAYEAWSKEQEFNRNAIDLDGHLYKEKP